MQFLYMKEFKCKGSENMQQNLLKTPQVTFMSFNFTTFASRRIVYYKCFNADI